MVSYDARHLHDLDRDQVQLPIIKKALKDPAFKQQLIADPRAAVARQLGMDLPPDVKISVIEESLDHFYIVLPPPLPSRSGELRDEELEAVAGGKSGKTTTQPAGGCACACMGTSSAAGSTLDVDTC